MKKPKSETSSRPPSLFARLHQNKLYVFVVRYYTLCHRFFPVSVSLFCGGAAPVPTQLVSASVEIESTQCDELALPRALAARGFMNAKTKTHTRRAARKTKPGLKLLDYTPLFNDARARRNLMKDAKREMKRCISESVCFSLCACQNAATWKLCRLLKAALWAVKVAA